MLKAPRVLAAAVIAAATITPSFAPAMPIADALAIKNAAPANVETVQWRGGWGWGLGAGFVAGAIVGGALAAPYYGYGPYYGGPYYYGAPPVVYGAPAPVYGGPGPGPAYGGAPVAGDATAYCSQRFRSYDPASGTYLGFDGQRHPCP